MTQDAAKSSSTGSIEALSPSERWFVDGFAAVPQAGGVVARLCDMSKAQVALHLLRARGLPATWTHLIVRAVALGLKRSPESHQVVAGYRRLRPAHADIGLSVAGRTNYAPVLIIPQAETRLLPDLVAFLNDAVPAARQKEERDLAGLNRYGWIIPFGPLRRWIMRLLGHSLWFRRRLVGTFQITCVSNADFALPLAFYSGAALGVGRVAERVLAVGGQAVVRPSVWLMMAIDHKTMDGRVAAALLDALIQVLEGEELIHEAEGPKPLWSAESSADDFAVRDTLVEHFGGYPDAPAKSFAQGG